MGLFTTAAAFGAGYTFGRPDGRAQLQRYLRQAREFADKPEVTRLRERGWDLAGDQMAAVKRRLDTRSSRAALDPTPLDPTPLDPTPSDPAAQHARRQMRRGWRRRPAVIADATVLTGRDDATPPDPSVVPDKSVAPDPSVVPDPSVPPADPVAGFGGTTVAEDSHAVILGRGTLPPPHRPGTPGPTPTSP